MILARSGADPSLVREAHPSGGWVTTFIGTHHRQLGPGEAPRDARSPVAFLVEQGANYVVRPHFHAANQFQVFIAGGGRFGKRQFDSPMVHYAAAHTPYGPIVAGGQGFAYFTLRDSFDPGPRYMPESREILRVRRSGLPERHAAIALVPRAAGRCPVFDVQPHGLGAWSIMLPPSARLDAPAADAGGGQFWIVLDGTIETDAGTLPSRSCLYRSCGAPAPTAGAGAAGLWLLIVQYPSQIVS